MEKLKKMVTGKNVLTMGFLFLIILILINGKPFGIERLKEITGGVGMLDLERNYTPQEAYALLDALGEQGRRFHMNILVYLDFLFPLSYTLFYISFSIYFLKKVFPNKDRILMIGLLPIFTGLFDYVENIFELILLNAYPTRNFVVASLANLANGLKFGFMGISMILMIVSVLSFVIIFFRRTSNTADKV